jgi:type IV secretion system protein VirB4
MAKDTTHQQNGMSEILPWLFIANDDCSVIANKDSSLMAAWEYTGVDIESGYSEYLEEASTLFDNLLRLIAEYEPVVWTRMDRRFIKNYPYSDINNPIANGIDVVWGSTFDKNPPMVSKHHLSLAMPVKNGGGMSLSEVTRANIDAGQGTLKALFEAVKSKYIGSAKSCGYLTKDDLDVMLNRFEHTLCSRVDNGNIGIDVRRLRGADFLGFLKSTASSNEMHPIAVDHTEYLDDYLSDTVLNNQFSDAIVLEGNERKYVAIFTLKKAPHAEAMQLLNSLTALPVELSIASCYKTLPSTESIKFLNNARTFDELRSMEFKKMLRSVAKQTADSSEDDDEPKTEVGAIAMSLKNEIKQKRAYCGWVTTTVMVYADSAQELKTSSELVVHALEQSDLLFIREREGALSGFCTGIPGQLTEPVRWHFVEAANVTDITPMITLTSGTPYHPFFSEGLKDKLPPNAVFRTRYNTPFYFNYHTGQLGHTLLIGPSRNGKTMLQMFLESQFLKYPNSRIFNIDKDLSCKPQTLLMDGEHINLEPGMTGIKFNPVSVADTELGRAWLVGWMDRLISCRGDRPTDHEIKEITDAVLRVGHIPYARLSTISSQLPESLRMRLSPWCEGGAWGNYFDNEEDNFSLAQITTVEVGGLLNAGLVDVVSAFTDYAFYRIEQFLMNRSPEELGATMVYFEEAGFLLDDEIFADKARDYLMTLAKKKAFLVMTAQSPEPFVNHKKLGAAVRDNISTIIFMPNVQAQYHDLGSKYKQAFGVNDNHLALIAGATPREEYCIFQPQTGLFRVVNAKFPMEIVAALRSDVKSQGVLNRIYDKEDSTWKERYLTSV